MQTVGEKRRRMLRSSASFRHTLWWSEREVQVADADSYVECTAWCPCLLYSGSPILWMTWLRAGMPPSHMGLMEKECWLLLGWHQRVAWDFRMIQLRQCEAPWNCRKSAQKINSPTAPMLFGTQCSELWAGKGGLRPFSAELLLKELKIGWQESTGEFVLKRHCCTDEVASLVSLDGLGEFLVAGLPSFLKGMQVPHGKETSTKPRNWNAANFWPFSFSWSMSRYQT